MNGPNEKAAGEMNAMLIAIYKKRMEDMIADPENMNASLLKEVREFLKQNNIELDPADARMQDLKTDANELAEYRNRRGGAA